mgnify:CR=1 FL=1
MTYFVTITSQGQMSIPVDIRRALGLDKSRKAIVRADGDKIVVEPVPDILSLRGIVKTKKKIPFWKTRKAFEEALSHGEA